MNLPQSILDKVCTCNARYDVAIWSQDENGYWIHWRPEIRKGNGCGKPSRHSAVFECDECGNKFFAPTAPGKYPVCRSCQDAELLAELGEEVDTSDIPSFEF